MPDEAQTQTAEAQAQGAETDATTEAQPVQQAVTMADLERLQNSMAANMRRMLESVTKPKNGKASETQHDAKTASPPQDFEAILARHRELDDALSEHSLTKEQRGTLRKLIGIDKPDDIAAYVAIQAKVFGRPSSGETQQPPSRTTNGRPPVSDAGSPGSPPTFTEDTPLVSMKPEDRAALIRQKGGEWYRRTLQAQMRGVRIKIR